MQWWQNLRFMIVCWLLRKEFPVMDLFVPTIGTEGDDAPVRAVIFATDTTILKRMVEFGGYDPPGDEP